MRFITDDTDFEILSVVNAVRQDKDSWKNWRCMKIEILSQGRPQNWQALSTNIKRILDIYLQGKQGTVFMCQSNEIDIFCKDVSETLLETMGRQIVEIAKSTANIASMFRVFELYEETETFLNIFCDNKSAQSKKDAAVTLQSSLPMYLPQIAEGKSDQLSNLNGRKVLLVEDDPVTRWMVKMALKNQCQLEVAPDAHKGLAAYKHSRPDMVLLDINLPGKNGHELMERIMITDPAAHIIMFSSQDSFENMVETMASGAKGFISKPFNRDRLVQCVQNCPTGR
jgi:CheY-like chemotaxis protein